MTQAIKSLGARTAGAAVLLATFATSARADDCTTDPINGALKCSKPNVPDRPLVGPHSFFQNVADTLIFLVISVSVIMLIVGGLRYVLSSGDAAAVKGAKDTILYAIIGIVVAILAFAIVSFVATRIGTPAT